MFHTLHCKASSIYIILSDCYSIFLHINLVYLFSNFRFFFWFDPLFRKWKIENVFVGLYCVCLKIICFRFCEFLQEKNRYVIKDILDDFTYIEFIYTWLSNMFIFIKVKYFRRSVYNIKLTLIQLKQIITTDSTS